MCGGIAPIGGQAGHSLPVFSGERAPGSGPARSSRNAAWAAGRVPPNGSTFNDFCATSGPNPVAISRNYIVSGDRVPAIDCRRGPGGAGPGSGTGRSGCHRPELQRDPIFPTPAASAFPTGPPACRFDVATSYVPTIQFVDVVGFWFNASIPPFLITNGRAGHAWLVMVPPDPPPAVAMPTLGDFTITGLNPVTGGESTIGQIDLSGLSRAGGPTITLTSSHPAIVPSTSIVAPATENLFGFQVFVETEPPAADTDVTITASDGRYSFSDVLTVLRRPPPPVLAGVSVNPTAWSAATPPPEP